MKVYDKPDETVARFWVREGYGGVYDTGFAIVDCAGRWLPVTIPEFPKPPPREKAPIRLCMATFKGKRMLFSYYEGESAARFRANSQDMGYTVWVGDASLSDIRWLTPEYLDELKDTPCSP